MTASPHHLRLPWFALAAIAGMFSMVGEASARTTNGSADGPKSFCVVPPSSDCCCCPAKVELVPTAIDRSAELQTGEARLSVPAVPCECRSGEPAEPVSRPESRGSERRPERAGDETTGSPFACRPSTTTFARFVPPTGSPPKSPLYLHTTHLLI